MPRKSFANKESQVFARHFAQEAEEARARQMERAIESSATDLDLAARETHQIAIAKRAYELHRATPEQITYLYRLGLIKL